VKEQDYSLNPGRYVGVVIEEDGKTEEEFLSDLSEMKTQFRELSGMADALTRNIVSNLDELCGDDA
jgi:type I restriction enzyme M protein